MQYSSSRKANRRWSAQSGRGVYLDYASTTPVDPKVLGAMESYFSREFGNPGSLHRFGQEASRAVFLARRRIAEAIGARYGEIIFTGSATEANNLALRGAFAAHRKSTQIKTLIHADKNIRAYPRCISDDPRPRLIISAVEHESILETARELERDGVEVIYLPVSRGGAIDAQKLNESLNERTVLVSVMYANNEIGTIQPIEKISAIIKDFRNARYAQQGGGAAMKNENKRAREGDPLATTVYPFFHTDAVQAFQYLDCGVNRLGVDMMTLSAHKMYGPKGIGALYARNISDGGGAAPQGGNKRIPADNPTMATVQPFVTGGGQEFGMRSGTENVPAIVGFAQAAELASLLREKEAARVEKLRDYFWYSMRKIFPQAQMNAYEAPIVANSAQTSADRTRTSTDGARVRTRASPRGSISRKNEPATLPNILSVYFPGVAAQEFLIKLDRAGVAASAGPACSARSSEPSHVLSAVGFPLLRARESIRFALGRPTTRKDIDAALRIIKNILTAI